MKLSHVVDALESLAPTGRAQDWDNVGLLAGDLSAVVSRVLLCIDLMPAVVSEAVRGKHQLVVSYHPPIFRGITRLVEPGAPMEAGIHRCIRKGIAVYSPHTALDVAPGGTNDVIAAHAGIRQAVPLPVEGVTPEHGIGRIGKLAGSLREVTRRLKRKTSARCVSIVGDPDRKLRRGIVVVGAAGSLPFDVGLRSGDVVITGEIRHHDALRIRREGACAIALSHWSSERPALASVATKLESMLPGIVARLSDADCEPFQRM
jgi:dinuclear metal center YbgI/SA1388 family protein